MRAASRPPGARIPGVQSAARQTILLAALSISAATILGAFGTHVLKPAITPQRFESFDIGVTYQFYHSLGLLFVGILQRDANLAAELRGVVRLLLIGMLLFCGSIYGLTADAPRVLGIVAPVGGATLMLAWAMLAFKLFRHPANGESS